MPVHDRRLDYERQNGNERCQQSVNGTLVGDGHSVGGVADVVLGCEDQPEQIDDDLWGIPVCIDRSSITGEEHHTCSAPISSDIRQSVQ